MIGPVEGGTKLTLVYYIRAGGLLKLFLPMVISTMRKLTKGNLSNLKSILEPQA